ncbi:hypothetical protein [Streptomyces europaeiscabiei]|uniref:hypothetical protein n=1 Tax=Streptomyces europaeiscabiei TaxID=146819 RepID=UPI0038F76EF5
MAHPTISAGFKAARHMFLCIGNMLGDGNANRFINFIGAAYITPVNKAQST